MNIDSILIPERTAGSLKASSKKRAIELVADLIAKSLPDLKVGDVYRSLIEREKLGTTAIGQGVAIPHCRLDCESIIGGLFVFDDPIDFTAHDDQPVQIVFVLLVPESETTEHLKTLAMLARRFEQEDYRNALMSAASNTALFKAATQPQTPSNES
jgi:PTS system nitrogen regulatory IIA component